MYVSTLVWFSFPFSRTCGLPTSMCVAVRSTHVVPRRSPCREHVQSSSSVVSFMGDSQLRSDSSGEQLPTEQECVLWKRMQPVLFLILFIVVLGASFGAPCTCASLVSCETRPAAISAGLFPVFPSLKEGQDQTSAVERLCLTPSCMRFRQYIQGLTNRRPFRTPVLQGGTAPLHCRKVASPLSCARASHLLLCHPHGLLRWWQEALSAHMLRLFLLPLLLSKALHAFLSTVLISRLAVQSPRDQQERQQDPAVRPCRPPYLRPSPVVLGQEMRALLRVFLPLVFPLHPQVGQVARQGQRRFPVLDPRCFPLDAEGLTN